MPLLASSCESPQRGRRNDVGLWRPFEPEPCHMISIAPAGGLFEVVASPGLPTDSAIIVSYFS